MKFRNYEEFEREMSRQIEKATEETTNPVGQIILADGHMVAYSEQSWVYRFAIKSELGTVHVHQYIYFPGTDHLSFGLVLLNRDELSSLLQMFLYI